MLCGFSTFGYVVSELHVPGFPSTVKPVCNDHLYDKIYYLWFIQ